MSFFHSLILGLIEGITEFLPISSTAHLIIAAKLFSLAQNDFQKFFEVFIQAGAILAVALLYINYLIKNKRIIKIIIFSFIPTMVVGFLFYRVIKDVFFESSFLMISTLILVGMAFISIEILIKRKKINLNKTIDKITISQALIIGFGQSLAVIPGVSRAGIVMLTMMLAGYKREESAKYSFLLAIPTILAASFFDLFQMRTIVFSSKNNETVLLFGFTVAFICAYLTIKWLVSYLQRNSLIIFGIYRLVLAIILLVILR